MAKIGVVILNYNGVDWFKKFLKGVVDNSPQAEIIVIDNASFDESVNYLKTQFPEVTLVINKENHGYAGGYNEGLRNLNHPYWVLLNSDVEVTPNWLAPIEKIFDEDESVVACQPKILSYNEKNKFEYAGAGGGMLDKYAYPFCRGRIFQEIEFDEGQYNDDKEVFWASGACMAVRSEVFNRLGGFDDTYFAHMEEIDLCWRMKNEGGLIMYTGKSTVYHVGGGTLDYNNPRKTYLNFRNSLFTNYKNYDGSPFFFIFRRLILDGIAGVKFLLGGQVKHIGAIFKAHFSFYGALSDLKKKRKKISHKSFKNMTGVYHKSIVWQHFIKKNKKYSELS